MQSEVVQAQNALCCEGKVALRGGRRGVVDSRRWSTPTFIECRGRERGGGGCIAHAYKKRTLLSAIIPSFNMNKAEVPSANDVTAPLPAHATAPVPAPSVTEAPVPTGFADVTAPLPAHATAQVPAQVTAQVPAPAVTEAPVPTGFADVTAPLPAVEFKENDIESDEDVSPFWGGNIRSCNCVQYEQWCCVL